MRPKFRGIWLWDRNSFGTLSIIGVLVRWCNMEESLKPAIKSFVTIARCNTCQINLADSSIRNHNNSDIHLHIIDSLGDNSLEYNGEWKCVVCDEQIPCSNFNRLLKKHFDSNEHKNKMFRNREITSTVVSQSKSDCIERKRSHSSNDLFILDLVKDLIEVKDKIEHVEKVIEEIMLGKFMSKLNVRPLTGLDLLASIVATDNQYSEQSIFIPSKKQRR